ncbi:dephospho-CoA kinase, partial [Mesorhizobium sp. M7A.F.Ca.US.014.04.1.1]
AETQRERVLARPGMTEEKLASILAKQVPDAEKRRQADFIVDTGQGMDAARAEVAAIISQLIGVGKPGG